jgi:hypothetical protein
MMGNSRPLKPQVESENKIESTTQKSKWKNESAKLQVGSRKNKLTKVESENKIESTTQKSKWEK